MTRIVPTIHRMLPEIVEQAKADALPKRPRWKRPIAHQEQYDETVAINAKLRAENPQPPRLSSDLRRQLGAARGAKTMKAKIEPERRARESAELEAEATIKKVVAALEMTMRNLNTCRAPKTYDMRINQKQIHNALVHLKTKCGVAFEPDEFSRHMPLDPSSWHQNRAKEDK